MKKLSKNKSGVKRASVFRRKKVIDNDKEREKKVGQGRHSIKFQMIMLLTLAVSLPMLIISAIVFYSFNHSIKGEVEASSLVVVNQSVQLINERNASFTNSLKTVLKDLADANNEEDAVNKYKEILRKYKSSSDYIYETYLVTSNDMKHSSSGGSSLIDDDTKYETWYVNAWDKALNFTEPKIEYNRLVYRITKKLRFKEGNALFVAEINITDILNYAPDIKVLEEGYTIVAARDGLILYHPEDVLIGQYLPDAIYEHLDVDKEVVNLAMVDEEVIRDNQLTYRWTMEDNHERFMNYKQDPQSGWIVMTSFELSEISEKLWNIIGLIFMIAFILIIIFSILGYFFARRLTLPIVELMKQMKAVEKGDLSAKYHGKTKSEVKVLGDSFNVMVAQLKQVILDLMSTFGQIESFVDTLTVTVDQTAAASNEISKSMMAIAEGAESQAYNTNHSVDLMKTMDGKFIAVNDSALNIKSSSHDAVKLNERGLQVVDALEEVSSLTTNRTDFVTGNMSSLSTRVHEVTGILEMINDISRKINLLALNASIEAARAGEHGRGFSVVADEIKKLAEQTGDAVGNIDELLKGVEVDVNQVSISVDDMQDATKQQEEQVVRSTEIFGEISHWIQSIVEQAEGIEKELEEAVTSKEAVTESIETIAGVAQDSSAVSEEVSAATEEQLASLEQLNSSTKELSDLVSGMKQEINRQFKID